MKRLLFLFVVSLLFGCTDAEEAERVELEARTDMRALGVVTSDLGYEVTLSQVRVVAKDVVFTVAGEVHTASALEVVSEWLLPRAMAHPGHVQGGEVTGELPGVVVLSWGEGEEALGEATLIEGDYEGSNFMLGHADEALVSAEDPLIGYSALIEGVAKRDGQQYPFRVLVDSPAGREVIGIPFEAEVRASTEGSLRFLFDADDALEGDTLFDQVEFAELKTDEEGLILLSPENKENETAYFSLRNDLQSHDHYRVILD